MLGFSFPVQIGYNPGNDVEKTWTRELMLRVIKAHAPVNLKEYQYLTPIENSVAQFLQINYP